MSRRLPLVANLVAIVVCAGCGGGGVDAAYGRVRGKSLNGTGAFAQLLRDQGHTVRVTSRLNEDVGDWAETIIRFAPYPGPPEQKEAEWLHNWLSSDEERFLIYVPCDFNAEYEYWDSVLNTLAPSTTERFRRDAEKQRDATKFWADALPPASKHPAGSQQWFALEPKPKAPATCKTLDGPWAGTVDAKAAAITRHQTLKPGQDEEVLLKGDGQPLVMHWSTPGGGDVLVVANGSFLLNEPLAHRARRALAMNVVAGAGEAPRNVAFVESRTPVENGLQRADALLWPFRVYPTGWVIAQWLLFMALLCLSAAAILGRPRSDPPSGEDRPVAHAEALGDLLRRTRDESTAKDLLETYRRWRHAASAKGEGR
jgi:hypothetical protein